MTNDASAALVRRSRILNRVKPFLIHIWWYSNDGQNRLAQDCNVSASTISRLVRGESLPTYQLAAAVTRAIEIRLGVPMDMREVFTTDGTYPTSCVCDLVPYCNGCFPPDAFNDDDTQNPDYRTMKSGDWCRYPVWVRPLEKRNQPINNI